MKKHVFNCITKFPAVSPCMAVAKEKSLLNYTRGIGAAKTGIIRVGQQLDWHPGQRDLNYRSIGPDGNTYSPLFWVTTNRSRVASLLEARRKSTNEPTSEEKINPSLTNRGKTKIKPPVSSSPVGDLTQNDLSVRRIPSNDAEKALSKPFLGTAPPYGPRQLQGLSHQAATVSATQELKKSNRFYTSYSKFTEVKLVTIGIADPLRILQWAEKTLPNGKIYGEVLNANTLHHKTFKPQKGGLFCSRIFGPLKDFTCACGKVNKSVKQTTHINVVDSPLNETDKLSFESQVASLSPSGPLTVSSEQQMQKNGLTGLRKSLRDSSSSFSSTTKEAKIRKFCPTCDVEYTWSVIRRYQLGYIKLASPVAHVWFFKGTPSYLSILLDIKRRDLQSIIYCSSTITLEHTRSTNLFNPTVGLLFPSLRESGDAKLPASKMAINTPSQIYLLWKQSFSKKTEKTQKTETTVDLVNPISQTEKQRRSGLAPKGDKGQQMSHLLARRTSKQTLNKKRKKIKEYESRSDLDRRIYNVTPTENRLSKENIFRSNNAILSRSQKNLNVSNKFYIMEPSHFLLSKFNPMSAPTGHRDDSYKHVKNLLPFLCSLQDSLMLHSFIYSFSSSSPEEAVRESRSTLGSTNRQFTTPLGTYSASSVLSSFSSSFKWKLGVYSVGTAERPTGTGVGVSFLNKTTFFIQFFKSLPVDFYIFCMLNRKVYKKTLMFSFFKLWQTIEKKAYYKAMYKVLSYRPILNTNENKREMNKRENDPSRSDGKPSSLLYKTIMSARRKVQKEKSIHESPVEKLSSTFLLRLFHFYQKNLLITLQHLKQPVISLYTAFITKEDREFKSDFFSPESLKSGDDLGIKEKNELKKRVGNRVSPKSYNNIPTVGTTITKVSSLMVDSPFIAFPFILSLLYHHFLRCLIIDILYGSNGTNTLKRENKQAVSSSNQSISFYNNWLIETSRSLRSGVASSPVGGGAVPGRLNKSERRLPDVLVKISNRLLSLLKRTESTNLQRVENEKLLSLTKQISPISKNGDSSNWDGTSNSGNLTTMYLLKMLKKTVEEMAPPLQGRHNKQNSRQNQGVVSNVGSTEVAKRLKKGLYNNFYTVSHREFWGERGRVGEREEKDWQFFFIYSYEPPQPSDLPIYAYKPFVGVTDGKKSIELSRNKMGLSNSFLNVKALGEGTGMNGMSNAFFSGPGILYQLLSELNYLSLRNFDKQNRLILYYLRKSISFLKKQLKLKLQPLGDGNETEGSGLGIRYTNRRLNKKHQQEIKELRKKIKDLCKKRVLFNRRTKLVRKLFKKGENPENMILTVLPVLPPDLRPIVKMGNQIAASDLNRLYQRVIYRNDRLKKFLKDPATSSSYEMKYSQRLLQEAVENLISNGKGGGTAEKDARGRSLKSLSDILKGKQGRFRQFLLGKRVDYSGRSVIVVGPKLKLHECGIPIEMALELYLPFLLKVILNQKYARTVVGAKALIHTNRALVIELLRDVMQVSPVLLNRAPTLHRLGFQAFIPRLVEGRAILLHPLVCSAFNADFDGDQMAVHVPITVEARAEAWKFMLSRNNLLSPATGDPLAIPSQDMVLGCYFLTTFPNTPHDKEKRLTKAIELQNHSTKPGALNLIGMKRNVGLFYNELNSVLFAYERKIIDLHSPVWVKWSGLIENGNDQEEPVEIRCSPSGHWQEFKSNSIRFYSLAKKPESQYMKTTPGRILFHTVIESTK